MMSLINILSTLLQNKFIEGPHYYGDHMDIVVYYPYSFGNKLILWMATTSGKVVKSFESPLIEAESLYNFTFAISLYPRAAYRLHAMVENDFIEHGYGEDSKTQQPEFCLHLAGSVMTNYRRTLSGGSFRSENGRFELQLDKMSTEGFFIYDYDLGRIVRSFTRQLYVELQRSMAVLYGKRANGQVDTLLKTKSGVHTILIGDTGQIETYSTNRCPGTLRRHGYPHVIGTCDSPEFGRTGTLYSGTYSLSPNNLITPWTGNPEDCSTEILRQSPHAEGWMMSQDRTQCIGFLPTDDTGSSIYQMVDISQNPPMQFCIFDSQCAGDFSIPESRMSDTVHNLAIEVGSVKTMHECSKSVKQLHSTAYMATMQNPLRAPFNASASYTCFAILLKLDGEANRMVFDHNFMSCFIKDRNFYSEDDVSLKGAFAYGLQYPLGKGEKATYSNMWTAFCFELMLDRFGSFYGLNVDLTNFDCQKALSRAPRATLANDTALKASVIFDGPIFIQ